MHAQPRVTVYHQCHIFLTFAEPIGICCMSVGLLLAWFDYGGPMLPVHVWLPEAHVEAPTAASVIFTAGILFKPGPDRFLRFCRARNRSGFRFSVIFPVFYNRSLKIVCNQ